MNSIVDKFRKWQEWIPLVGAGLLLFVMRLLPLVKAPLATYGYDFGFYAFAARAPYINLATLFPSIFGGYNSPLFLLFHWLHLPWPGSIEVSLIVFSVVLGLIFAWFAQSLDSKITLLALLLFAFSIPQSQAYLMFLYKTILASCGLLFVFRMVVHKKWLWAIAIGIATLILHRTTGLVLLGTAALYFIFDLWLLPKFSWKRWVIFFAVLFGIGLLTIFLQNWVAEHILHSANTWVTQGIFLSLRQYWFWFLPFLILAIIGYKNYRTNKNLVVVHALAALTGLWILIRLPFSERIVYYFDFALLIYAAFGAQVLLKKRLLGKIIFTFLFFWISFGGIWFNLHAQPLITQTEVKEIKNFDQIHPNGFVIITNPRLAPWFLPYTKSQRLLGPGLFENTYSLEEWQKFWQGDNIQKFLAPFPRPLYLYQPMEPQLKETCVKQVSENFFEYQC
jgi:hypothetical protein